MKNKSKWWYWWSSMYPDGWKPKPEHVNEPLPKKNKTCIKLDILRAFHFNNPTPPTKHYPEQHINRPKEKAVVMRETNGGMK